MSTHLLERLALVLVLLESHLTEFRQSYDHVAVLQRTEYSPRFTA